MLSELVARVEVGEIWVKNEKGRRVKEPGGLARGDLALVLRQSPAKAAGGDLLRDIHGLKASGVGRVTEPRSVHAVTIRARAEMIAIECWVHACQSPNRECRNSCRHGAALNRQFCDVALHD